MIRKLASTLAALAFAASLSAGAVAKPHDMGGGMMGTKHKCPTGQHWVKAYNKKNGQHVKGHCSK